MTLLPSGGACWRLFASKASSRVLPLFSVTTARAFTSVPPSAQVSASITLLMIAAAVGGAFALAGGPALASRGSLVATNRAARPTIQTDVFMLLRPPGGCHEQPQCRPGLRGLCA